MYSDGDIYIVNVYCICILYLHSMYVRDNDFNLTSQRSKQKLHLAVLYLALSVL